MFGMTNRPSALHRPRYLGDDGTWTERGPVGWTEPMPNPPWIGTTEIYTGTVGLDYIRTMVYFAPAVTPTGLSPAYDPPGHAGIGAYGQPLAPSVGNVEFFGTGG